jgi:hypothetical protein
MSAAARAIVDVALSDVKPSVLHLAHPRPVSWTHVFSLIAARVGVPLVPYGSWLETLEAKIDDQTLDVVSRRQCEPALKLTGMFRERASVVAAAEHSAYEGGGHQAMMFPRLDMTFMLEVSPGLGSVTELGLQDVELWLSYWART